MKGLLQRISYTTSMGRFVEITEFLDEHNIDYDIQSDYDCMGVEYNMIRNIIVHLGTGKADIALSAHWDIVRGSCGANDNGASCVILMMFILGYKKEKPIDVIFFDREETGFLGSHLFAKRNKIENYTIINLDVCGSGDDIVMVDDLTEDNKYEDILFNENTIGKYDISFADSFPPSDILSFKNTGIQTVSISVFPRKDTDYLTSVSGKYENKKYFKYIKKRDFNYGENAIMMGMFRMYLLEIFQYMHCADKDDIEYINFDIMQNILDYLNENM